MELREFIKTSISEITEAIKELKKEYNKNDSGSNAYGSWENNPVAPRYQVDNKINKSVDFDIAVISSESDKNAKEGRVGIKVVGGEISSSNNTTKENSSRIKFSVPFYPEYIDKK